VAKRASVRKRTSGQAKKAAKAPTAKKAARKAVRKTAKKAATKAARKAVKTTAKKGVRKAARRTVKKSARKAARKAATPPAAAAIKAEAPAAEPSRKPKRVKSPLTAAQLRKFRSMLLAKRRELVGDMTGIEAEALGADRQEVKGDISDHPADAGTDNFEQEFSLGLLESERILLGEIDEALGRIEQKTYGICLGTGRPIGTARLKARPWAKYCIEYARMVEKGLVRPGERLPDDE